MVSYPELIVRYGSEGIFRPVIPAAEHRDIIELRRMIRKAVHGVVYVADDLFRIAGFVFVQGVGVQTRGRSFCLARTKRLT